jgi:hypothetical protein
MSGGLIRAPALTRDNAGLARVTRTRHNPLGTQLQSMVNHYCIRFAPVKHFLVLPASEAGFRGATSAATTAPLGSEVSPV